MSVLVGDCLLVMPTLEANIELSEEYAEIARARIAEYAPLFADGAA